MPTTLAEQLFLEFSAKKLRQLSSQIQVCLEKLNDDQIWLRAGDNSNAVGNLCLHLAGNVRQWIMHGVAGQPDLRHRDGEFAARGQVSTPELWQRLNAAVQEACAILEQTPGADLTRIIRPQNYDVTMLEGIYHVVEHFAQHTGQILYATKVLCGALPPPPPVGQETP